MTTTTKFKSGDKVRIVRRVPVQVGWCNSWVPAMDAKVGTGRILTVSSSGEGGVRLRECDYGWPPSALELVTETDPKALKVGDTVRFKDTPEDQYARRMFDPSSTKDAVFVISGTSRWDTVKLNGKDGGFFRTRFDLVKAAPEPTIKGFHAHTLILDELPPTPKKGVPRQSHIVVGTNAKGQFKPASTPFVHPTKASAETEASRLAKENPGQTFVVFSSVNEVSATAPLVTVTSHAAA